MAKKRINYTPEQKAEHLKAYEASGLSIAEFAKTAGLREGNLRNWIKAKENKKPGKKRSFKKSASKKVVSRASASNGAAHRDAAGSIDAHIEQVVERAVARAMRNLLALGVGGS